MILVGVHDDEGSGVVEPEDFMNLLSGVRDQREELTGMVDGVDNKQIQCVYQVGSKLFACFWI